MNSTHTFHYRQIFHWALYSHWTDSFQERYYHVCKKYMVKIPQSREGNTKLLKEKNESAHSTKAQMSMHTVLFLSRLSAY